MECTQHNEWIQRLTSNSRSGFKSEFVRLWFHRRKEHFGIGLPQPDSYIQDVRRSVDRTEGNRDGEQQYEYKDGRNRRESVYVRGE